MSPLDPTKVFVESIAGALGAVEDRQQRMIQTILDSLPSLFGFRSKTGALPVGLFSFKPRLLAKEHSLARGTSFRFQKGTEALTAFLEVDSELMSVHAFKAQKNEKHLELSFHSDKALSHFSFQYIPQGESANKLLEIRSNLGEALLYHDETQGFTSYGTVTVYRADRQPLLSASGEVKIKLIFEREPEGDFKINILPCSIASVMDSMALGSLQGEAWEEVRLPTDILEVPNEAVLRYPSGESVVLTRIQNEALRARNSGESFRRFDQGFFYQGVRHSLILPGADTLKNPYNGGVTVHLGETTVYPLEEGIPLGYQAVLGNHASQIEEVLYLQKLRPAVLRESASDYLERFYAVLRSFPKQESPHGSFLGELNAWVANLDTKIKKVEVSENPREKSLEVYCLSDHPQGDGAFYLSTDLKRKLEEVLTKVVPLDYRWSIHPFKSSKLVLQLDLGFEIDEHRFKEYSPRELEIEIKKVCERVLLPKPFGLMECRLMDKKSILEIIRQELSLSHPFFSKIMEEAQLKVLIQNESGVFLDGLAKKPGECWMAEVVARVTPKVLKEVRYA